MGFARRMYPQTWEQYWRTNLIPQYLELMMNNNGMKFLAHQKGVGGSTASKWNKSKEEIVCIDYWIRQEESAE